MTVHLNKQRWVYVCVCVKLKKMICSLLGNAVTNLNIFLHEQWREVLLSTQEIALLVSEDD